MRFVQARLLPEQIVTFICAHDTIAFYATVIIDTQYTITDLNPLHLQRELATKNNVHILGCDAL